MVPFLIVSIIAAISIPLYWKLYEKPEAVFFTIMALLVWGTSAFVFLT